VGAQVLVASSGVEIPDPQSVDAGLRDAHKGMKSMTLLGKHSTTAASAVKDGPEDLDAADNLQTTYLHTLRFLTLSLGSLRMYGPLSYVGSELIELHSYILTQMWCWVCCLLHPKYV
jgi:hypothetical protein